MAKAHCPACSARMRAKDKHCSACGKRNPLFAPKGGQAVKAVRPALVKAAPPLTLLPAAQQAASAHWMRELYQDNDPGQRVNLWNMAHPWLNSPRGAA